KQTPPPKQQGSARRRAPPPGGPRPARPPPRKRLDQVLTTSSRDKLPVANSFDREQLIRNGPNAPRRAAQRDDLEAGVLVEVHVEARGDRAEPVVLDVRQLVRERVSLVVVDEGQY